MGKGELTAKQRAVLMELVFVGAESGIEGFDREPREDLRARGFIALEKRGRKTYMQATDAAWGWVADHLDADIGRAGAHRAFAALRARLKAHLESSGLALAEFMRPAPVTHSDGVGEIIRARCRELTGGRRDTRVRLSALRRAMPDLPREAVDQALRQMSRDHSISLFPIEDRSAITEADRSAAISLSGVPHHLVYLEG